MLRYTFAFPAMGRALLAASLCVLAFAFAMEAKMAWYGPPIGAARDISSAKALPADTPAVVNHGAQMAIQDPFEPVLTWFAAFAALLIAVSGAGEFRRLAKFPIPVVSRPHFSPALFFRPPPFLR